MITETTDNNAARLHRALEWAPGILPPAAAALWPPVLPAWVLMWLLALSFFAAAKWLTWRRASRHRAAIAPGRALGFLLTWPGMDPLPWFAGPSRKPDHPAGAKRNLSLATGPVIKMLAGFALMWAALSAAWISQPLLKGWMAMAGLVLLLHFGLFHLLALAWQRAGVEVQPIMQKPMLATSLNEFWSRRWNTAFNQLASELAFKPMVRRLGVPAATLVAFVLSGLVHEVVISLPARAGYGLPTAYFLLQGFGVLVERTNWGRKIGLGRGSRGWLFTVLLTAAPAYWLFHPSFVLNVIIPMLDAISWK